MTRTKFAAAVFIVLILSAIGYRLLVSNSRSIQREPRPPNRFELPFDVNAANAVRKFLVSAGFDQVDQSQFSFHLRKEVLGIERQGVHVGWSAGSEGLSMLYDKETDRILEFINLTRENWSVQSVEPKGKPLYEASNGPRLIKEMAKKLEVPTVLSLGSCSYQDVKGHWTPDGRENIIFCGAAILDISGKQVGAITVDLYTGKLHMYWLKPWLIKE